VRADDPPTGLSRTTMSTRTGALQPTFTSGREQGTSPVVTAEIPAVPAGSGYGVLLPDGSIWYPGSRKRLPAPLPLRVAVWTLAFLVLIAAAADLIIRTHPSWVDPLRRHVNPALSASLAGGTPGSRPSAGSSAATSAVSLSQASPQPSGMPGATTAYTLTGTSRFQVAVKASELTYMKASQLVNGQDSGTPLYVGYVQPGHTETVTASGPVDVQVDAGGTTVSVLSGGKLVGTVATPPYVPWDFWFLPATKS
jgi:hypothetical protein